MSKSKEVVTQEENALALVGEITPDDIAEMQESLESFEGEMTLPYIQWKDGDFKLSSSDEVGVKEFEGVVLYTKKSNIYYDKKYKPGQKEAPRCFSPDGIIPTVDYPISPTCKECHMNVFGSAGDGVGKACKNTRPLFILTLGSIMPRILRVPPTSLVAAKEYVRDATADYMSYANVVTKFSLYKKDEAQTHYNMRFKPVRRLNKVEKSWVKSIKEMWIGQMKEMNTGIDDEQESAHEVEPEATTTREF